MLAEQNEKRFTAALNCLCKNISRRLLPLAPKLADSVQEIRLRLSRPLALVCPDNTYYLTQNGGLSNTILDGAMLVVSKADIVDTFNNICNYSVYNRQNEIVNGFVTMYGGHRAGICGTAVVNNGKIVNIRDITSINVRIAREHKGCADSLYNKIIAVSGGVLICGAPCSGKTTVLRDLARLLSTKGKKNVALIMKEESLQVRHRENFRMISECAMSMIHTTRARQCFTQSAVWLPKLLSAMKSAQKKISMPLKSRSTAEFG